MKKIFLKLLFLIFIITLSTKIVSAEPFSDITEENIKEAVNYLFERDILAGYEDGTYRPDAKITRAEFSKLIVASSSLSEIKESFNPFTDTQYHWANSYINTISHYGLVIGYSDGTFKPQNHISYAEVVTVLIRVLMIDSQVNTNLPWPNNYIELAKSIGLDKNLNIQNWSNYTDRGDIAIALYNAMQYNAGNKFRGKANITPISIEPKNVFITDGETIKLSAYDQNGNIISNDVIWTADKPEFVLVDEGNVSIIREGFGRTRITATTSNGLTAKSMVIYKSSEVVTEDSEEGKVYIKHPSILSIENVYPEIPMWYCYESDDQSFIDYRYNYIYQAITIAEADDIAAGYVEYLINNGYNLVRDRNIIDPITGNKYDRIYELLDPDNLYLITIKGTIAAVGDSYQHANVDVWIEENEEK